MLQRRMDMNKEKIGKFITKLRKKKGISQEVLAKKMKNY